MILTRALRLTGWTLITAGCVVLLYLVYALFFTGFETSAAQAELAEEWDHQLELLESGGPDAPVVEEDDDPDEVAVTGGAVAAIEFVRPGSEERPVRADPLFVVEGVSLADLTRGPGHYPDSEDPGGEGNFAVAGHRTTYGAPFYHLNQLVEGDEVHVTGRDGRRHVYRVDRQEVVSPDDVWVIGSDPLGTGNPTLTLTTCHPRFSAAQRLVVFAELVE